MKISVKFLVLALVTAAAVGAVVIYIQMYARHYQETDNAYIKIDRVVEAPKVSGYVASVNVVDNQKVLAGDVLVQINPEEFEARIAQEEATLLGRKAALEVMKRRKALAYTEIDQSVSTLEGTIAQAGKALLDKQRDKKLLDDGFISRYQSEVSQVNSRVAESNESRARSQQESSHRQVYMMDAQLTQLRAEILHSQATLDLLKLDRKNSKIVAPANGIVGNKTVEVGQYVRAGTQLLTLVLTGNIHVIANFKETQLASLNLGQSAELRVDAYPNMVLSGHIESIAPATGSEFSLLPPENATGNFTKIVQRIPVRIAINNSQSNLDLLLSGMSVNVRVNTSISADGDKPLINLPLVMQNPVSLRK